MDEALPLDAVACEALAGFEWLSPLHEALHEPLDASVLRFEPLDLAVDARLAPEHEAQARPTAESRAKQRRAKASFDSNRARTERRLELLHLRQQAGELERHLTILRRKEQRRKSAAVPRAIGASADDSGIAATLAARSWRQTARALSSEREKAEKENIRLRLLVDGHVKTARQLRRILLPKRQRRIQIDPEADPSSIPPLDDPCGSSPLDAGMGAGLEGQSGPGSVRTITSMCPETIALCNDSVSTNTQIFEILSRSLSHARNEMDSLFVANGLAATEKAYRSARVEQNEASGTMIEFVASKVFPHPMELTESIVWRHFGYSQRDMPDRRLFRYHDNYKDVSLNEDPNTMAAFYSLDVVNSFVSCKFDEWRVMRRYVEGDRTIIIFCLLANLTEFAKEPTTGIRVLEQVYVVLRQPTCAIEGGEDATLMQTCYRLQPIVYKPVPGVENTLAAVTDFLFAFVAGTVSVHYQMIERDLKAATQRAQAVD